MTKEFPSVTVASADSLTQKLQLNNVFFVAKRTLRDTNQEVLYLSLKLAPSYIALLEVTYLPGVAGAKVAIKTTNPEFSEVLFESVQALIS